MSVPNDDASLRLERKQEALHITVLAAALALIPLLALLLVSLVSSLVSLCFPSAAESVFYRWALGSLPIYFAGMPAAWWLLRSLPARAPARRRCNVWQMSGALAVLIGTSHLLAKLWTWLEGMLPWLPSGVTDSNVNAMAVQTPLWMLLLYSVVLAPLFEEWMYRKLLVDRMSRYGALPAVLVSGVAFALSHGNLTQAVPSLLAGMILACVYLVTGRMSCTVGLHAAFNLLCGVLPTWMMRLQGTAYTVAFWSYTGVILLSISALVPLLFLFVGDLKREESLLPTAVGRMSLQDWVRVTLGNVGVWFYVAVIGLLLLV